MEKRVAADTATWVRLITCASGLSRTVQASLDKLALAMTETGFVRAAVALLRRLTRRSKSTICDHLGTAQAAGWLTVVERGGYRAEGGAAAAYQATVPSSVWERRSELLAVFESGSSDQALTPFAPGDIVPGHAVSEVESRFRSALIDQSIIAPSPEKPQQQQGNRDLTAPNSDQASEDPDLVAAVIEELAAHTDETVDRAWAARVASQILGRRRIKYPLNYVVRSIQNAAHDGTIRTRFLPAHPDTAAPKPREEVAPVAPATPARRQPQLGLAPWDRDDARLLPTISDLDDAPPAPKPSVQPPLMNTVSTGAPATKADLLTAAGPASEVPPYKPELRLAGLGSLGSAALRAERERQEARRRARQQEAMAG